METAGWGGPVRGARVSRRQVCGIGRVSHQVADVAGLRVGVLYSVLTRRPDGTRESGHRGDLVGGYLHDRLRRSALPAADQALRVRGLDAGGGCCNARRRSRAPSRGVFARRSGCGPSIRFARFEPSVRRTRWRALSSAPDGEGAQRTFRVTHPFHPLHAQVFELLTHRHNWGEDRVYYLDSARRVRCRQPGPA